MCRAAVFVFLYYFLVGKIKKSLNCVFESDIDRGETREKICTILNS